ncbi:MAG: hypothetical protein R3286_08115, partial [Gammaproteobacteria bacterium]|nr:hypothetical protein [Gammaproteobacteria bacterium]
MSDSAKARAPGQRPRECALGVLTAILGDGRSLDAALAESLAGLAGARERARGGGRWDGPRRGDARPPR